MEKRSLNEKNNDLIACVAMEHPPPLLRSSSPRNRSFSLLGLEGRPLPHGRPKIADNLLERALDVSIEDVWEYLRDQGYVNQFEGGWQALHIEKPFAGRALTAQFMPRRPDMAAAVGAEGKAEKRVSERNSWVINELQMGDTMVCDGYGKIIEGTLIGSNLGSGIAAHTHSGFVFNAGIRDAEENREIANLNGFYRGYDPSAWAQMQLTGINGQSVSGELLCCRATWSSPSKMVSSLFQPHWPLWPSVRPNYQPPRCLQLRVESTRRQRRRIRGGWTPKKYAAFAKWVKAYPEKLKMTRDEFSTTR